MTLDFCHNSKTEEKGLQRLYMIEQTYERTYAQFCALWEHFGTCITKPDSSTRCFVGHKSNLHKLILNDFEKIADNFFTIQHLLNYRFLQRN